MYLYIIILKKDQKDLFAEILNFKKKAKRKSLEKKQQKNTFLKTYIIFLKVEKEFFNAFDSKIFLIKSKGTDFLGHSNLKILTPKQMCQRLPIALAQVKTGNTSENLLNEIKQIIYSLYRTKEINKKVYKNIMNSIKV